MASTLLRFRNPQVFQIIDRHAYRAIYAPKVLKPSTVIESKVSMYFEYLDRLWEPCEELDLSFDTIDRLLYEFDKQKNGPL